MVVVDIRLESPAICIMDAGRGASLFGIIVEYSTSACCVVVVCSRDRNGNCIERLPRRCDLAVGMPLTDCEDVFRTVCACVFLPYVLMIVDGRDNVLDGIESKMHRTTRPHVRHISDLYEITDEH